MNNSSDPELSYLRTIFPQADEPGAALPNINLRQLRQIAVATLPPTPQELSQCIIAHHQFLNSGGAGGSWKTLLVNGLVLGFYSGAEGRRGKQASFEHRCLTGLTGLAGQQLPYANCCGTLAEGLDATAADLSYCLFSDAWLPKATFDEALLRQSDFSRAHLVGASFAGADLRRADFENCDLRGADFSGALLAGARFPGANLEGVKY
ncbi:MAG: pentapeptide repeat-containing protein [Bacteroidota bacterium]